MTGTSSRIKKQSAPFAKDTRPIRERRSPGTSPRRSEDHRQAAGEQQDAAPGMRGLVDSSPEERRRNPSATVIFMIPNEHVVPPYRVELNGKRKLVAISGISKKQQRIEWHVPFEKIGIRSKSRIVADDAIERPDEAERVVTNNSVSFLKQLSKVLGKFDSQPFLCMRKLRPSGGRREFAL